MSDTNQQDPNEATFESPNFTAEEQSAFEDMQRSRGSEGDAPPPQPEADPPAPPPGDQGQQPLPLEPGQQQAPGQQKPAAAVGEEDDDDDDDGSQPAADGKQTVRRVSRKKHERLLAKANEDARTAREEAQRLQVEQARVTERLKIISEAMQTPEAPQQTAEQADPEPDPEENLFEWINWSKRKIGRLEQAQNQFQNGYQERQQAQQADGIIKDYYRHDVQEFVAQEPAFLAAYNHLMASRDLELQEHGYKNAQQRHQIIVNEERELIVSAIQESQQTGRRVSAAAKIMAFAKARGFDPAKAAQNGAQQTAAPAPGGGAGAAPAPAGGVRPQQPNVQQEVERIRNGVAAGTSLSDGSGAPSAPITAHALANMSDDEFGAYVASLPKSKQRELLGN